MHNLVFNHRDYVYIVVYGNIITRARNASGGVLSGSAHCFAILVRGSLGTYLDIVTYRSAVLCLMRMNGDVKRDVKSFQFGILYYIVLSACRAEERTGASHIES